MLMRVQKRRSSFSDDFEEAYVAEFGMRNADRPDMALSVYEIDDIASRHEQTIAEHTASLLSKPPTFFSGIDFHDPEHEATQTEGATCFQFTRASHRELRFSDVDAHRRFAESVYAQWQTRKRPVEKVRVKAYIGQRVRDGDEDWRKLCATKEHWSKWVEDSRGDR
ncbi:MAG: hypothetical protein L6Q76_13470 [Polyangiaceae bacterium]|nr:hypothetical protein [Polyangiaceae bacterium]